MYKNYLAIKDLIDFKIVKRTSGTFTNFDSLDDKIDDLYYYMQFIKFGFGRCSRDCSRFIQNGHLSRKKLSSMLRTMMENSLKKSSRGSGISSFKKI